jgi:hypothetical protein
MNPRRAPTWVRLRHRANQRTNVSGYSGRPRRRLFQAHQSRKPRRCQAITVSGLTITSAVRHPVRAREIPTQSHRSTFVSRNRRGRVRCSTCSWCCRASTSSWSAAREYAHVRRVRRSEVSTGIRSKRIHRWPQHQPPQQERTFQQPQPTQDLGPPCRPPCPESGIRFPRSPRERFVGRSPVQSSAVRPEPSPGSGIELIVRSALTAGPRRSSSE